MELNDRMITVRLSQLEEVYRLAEQITSLHGDDTAYSLGYAQATAGRILSIIRSVSYGKIGGEEVNKYAGY